MAFLSQLHLKSIDPHLSKEGMEVLPFFLKGRWRGFSEKGFCMLQTVYRLAVHKKNRLYPKNRFFNSIRSEYVQPDYQASRSRRL